MFTVTLEVSFDDENVNSMNRTIRLLRALQMTLGCDTGVAVVHVTEEYIQDDETL